MTEQREKWSEEDRNQAWRKLRAATQVWEEDGSSEDVVSAAYAIDQQCRNTILGQRVKEARHIMCESLTILPGPNLRSATAAWLAATQEESE